MDVCNANQPMRKKTWSELKSVVSDLRKQLSSLCGIIPTNIHFRSLTDGRTRIYFLSPPPNGFQTTLLYTDIQSHSENTQPQKLQWHPLLEPSIPTLSSNTACPRETQLLMERKRLSSWGITEYELHKKSGRIIFPAIGTLYQCIDTGFNTSPLFPSELRVCQLWTAIDPQICPNNSDLIAYVCGGDLWVTHAYSGHGERLTFAHDGRRTSFADDPLSAGVPSYVMQEEFNRYQGYWWQPNKSEDGIYRIVYEEVDESDVCLFTFPSSQSVGGDFEEYRFPRAGTPNAKSKLKLVQFTLSETLQITDICVKDLQYPLNFSFPWLEYIVRVGWTPDSKFVWAQIMNRTQQRLELVLIPLDNFCESCGSVTSSPNGDHRWNSPLGRSTTPIQVIYKQTSTNWVNVNDLLTFLEINDTTVTFLWGSEDSGFRHLYLVTSSLVQSTNGIKDSMVIEHTDCINLVPSIISKTELTSGDWEVLSRSVWVDKTRQLIYFIGLRETPLEKHLYVVSLRKPGEIRLLTVPGYSYSVEFNDECTLLIQIYCNTRRLPSCEVFKVEQMCGSDSVHGIELTSLGYLIEGGPPENFQYSPAIFSPRLPNGETLYAMVFKPHNFELGMRYPTVLNVYGGPEVQTVNNTFKGMRQLRMHMLAAQGYCVVCVDSRGSRHRGVSFESHLRGKMGQVELADQVAVLKILADQLGFIDLNRVGIHGWSYGGYLTLMGLIQHPDVFKVAIAGAPVTNWEYYDTGYTERYMDLPENNKQGYVAGSVLSYIHKFPEEDNRLLIIHGLIDENVHFFHTSQLINQLIKANKPYQLQVYPNERHSLRNLDASKHYETTLLSFLQNNL
ncbi:Dipeptidyl peptidase 8 [Pseudolycoriella hygida]|uniref:Dipeptidyl peptidase 8 n=1 Tax=Pseudolycoriella hygida TaxID=35572 RepID=A0A9Q0MSH5_9DIPT|nr:Dipeptidyl peptidase 8 [Pseudolycoriella hygida]